MDEIVQPTADAMVAEGVPFQGVLFAGLMIKDGRIKLLEHNVRFGDPECQCLMALLQTDLLELLLHASQGELSKASLAWSDQAALTVVLAAKGYPGAYAKGSAIRGLDQVQGAKVFHAGTSSNSVGDVVASGGRVLGVTACGDTVHEAQALAYAAVARIDWPEGFHRNDIGWRATARAPEE
jgi:phosphoribosylamine---glycine ligase